MTNIKFKDMLNEGKFVVIDPRGNPKPVGSKIQGNMYTKKMGGPKKGWFVVPEKNARKAQKLVGKFGANHSNSTFQEKMFDLMYENKLNEVTAKDTLANAVNALTKTFGGKKLDQRYVKDYLKSIEQMARKKPMDFVKDYGKFKNADWIEDVEYNMQNEGRLKLKNIIEANPDGTISKDEDKKREKLVKDSVKNMKKFIDDIKKQADKIGGSFRSPGIRAEVKKAIKGTFEDL